MMQSLRFMFRSFLPANRGVALIEFALVFPVIMLLLFGALEVARAMVITQRVEKVAYVLSDVTSQYPPATSDRAANEIDETELMANVFPQYFRILGTYGDPARQQMILTSVRRESGAPRIKWQIVGGGTLTKDVTSVVNGLAPGAIGAGVKNTVATFGSDKELQTQMGAMADGENLVVAEVFFQYEPIWNRVIGAVSAGTAGETVTIAGPRLLVKRMYFRPRNGDLICLPDTFIYPECLSILPPDEPDDPPPLTCAPGECAVIGEMWSDEPCSGCVSNRRRVTSVGDNCRISQCENGILRDIGPARSFACVFDSGCI